MCVLGVLPELAHVAIIGHNPGLTELYEVLTGEPLDNLPTFGVAHLAVPDQARWGAVGKVRSRVIERVFPRSL